MTTSTEHDRYEIDIAYKGFDDFKVRVEGSGRNPSFNRHAANFTKRTLQSALGDDYEVTMNREVSEVALTLNDVNVRLHVQLGASVTLGLYDGPITREHVAAHLEQMFEAGVQEFIEKIEIVEVATDDETYLVIQEGGGL